MEFTYSLMSIIFGLVVLFPYVNFNGVIIPILSIFGLFLPLVKLSHKELLFWVTLSILILGYALLGSSIIQNSISLIKTLIATFFVFSLMSIALKRYKLSEDQIISLIISVGIFNAFISISATLIADFRIIYEFISVNPKVFDYPIPRYPGLVYDGFSYLSVFYSLLYLLSMQTWREKKISNTRFLFNSLVLLTAILTSGRFGLLIALMGSLVIFFGGRSIGFGRALFVFLVVFLAALVGIRYSPTFYEYIMWNSVAILSLITGNFSADSTVSELIENHFFLIGDSFSDFLFGTFDFGFPGGNYSSDVGWVRIFNGFGVIGVITTLLSAWYVCRKSKYLIIFYCVFIIALFKDWYFMFPYYFWAVGFALYFANKADLDSKQKIENFVE